MDYKPILEFWLGKEELTPEYLKERMGFWFKKDLKLDLEIRERFLNYFIHFENHGFDDWLHCPRGRLALLILLDQFSRNAFRDTTRAFAYDEFCQRLSQFVCDGKTDLTLSPIERIFIYLPFEHSEHMDMQERSMEKFTQLYKEITDSKIAPVFKGTLDYAKKHYDIIKRFGQFPHRNKILNRTSSQDEVEFLKNKSNNF